MQDTIAAIATGLGPCGVAIVRISGDEAFAIAGAVFSSVSGAAVDSFRSHTVHYGRLLDPVSSEPIDDVLLTVFRAPKSYTAEDVIEISCHGGLVTTRRVLEAVLRAGARLAEPGEFTRRAFLNGRLDLAQAEAVNDLIRARTDDAQRIARAQLEGGLSQPVRELSEELMSMLAEIEASVDFPEDVDEPERHAIARRTREVGQGIRTLLESFGRGRVYREGLRMVIAGRPNVGKSSLLNALLGQARAIVTPIPGTTRDTIEETLSVRGIPVVAVDTAGLRESTDAVEKIGVELAERSLAAADLVIFVVDLSSGVTAEDLDLLARFTGRPLLTAANKVDLLPASERTAPPELAIHAPIVAVSALTGEGIEALEAAVESLVLVGQVSAGSAVVSNARHKEALSETLRGIEDAMRAVEAGEPLDLVSMDLMAARAGLGEITGETATEDLLDRIFGQFCIGK